MSFLGGLFSGIGNAIGGLGNAIGSGLSGIKGIAGGMPKIMGNMSNMRGIMPPIMGGKDQLMVPSILDRQRMIPFAGTPEQYTQRMQQYPGVQQPVARPGVSMGNLPGMMQNQIARNMARPPMAPIDLDRALAMRMPREGGIPKPVQTAMANFQQGSNMPVRTQDGTQSGMSSSAPNSNVNPGYLSARYEIEQVANRPIHERVGFISTGMGGKDPGGISYGPYQLESKKGTLQGYLRQDNQYARQLNKYPVNSPEFKQQWKNLAKADPIGFRESQFEYLANKPNGFNDAMEYARLNGWDVENPYMQNAIYSIVNQSGGWRNGIFEKAGIMMDDPLETQINKLYDARGRYFDKGANRGWFDRDVHRGITNKRVNKERDYLLEQLSNNAWSR